MSPSANAALSFVRSVTSHPSAVPAIHVPTFDVINPVQSKTKLRDSSAAKPPRLEDASALSVIAGDGVSIIGGVEATGAEPGWAFIVADGTTRQKIENRK